MSYAYIPRAELDYDLAAITDGLPEPAAAVFRTTAEAIIVRVADGSMQGEPLFGNLHDCLKIKFDLL